MCMTRLKMDLTTALAEPVALLFSEVAERSRTSREAVERERERESERAIIGSHGDMW